MKRSALRRKKGLKRGTFKRAARKSLRRVSKKRAKRNREAQPLRKDFCLEIGQCEICDSRTINLLAHEIPRSDRANAYTVRAAMLCLCWQCHEELHASPAVWTKTRQLAVIYTKRRADYDLATYNRLATAKVDHCDVVSAAIGLFYCLDEEGTKGRKRA